MNLTQNTQMKQHSLTVPGSRAFRLRLFLEGILVGLLAGAAVAFYRLLIARAEDLRRVFYDALLLPSLAAGGFLPLLGWLVFLLAAAFFLAALVKAEPMAKGSGIPQVKGFLRGRMQMRALRVLFVQIFGGALAIGCGLSLGHAGPAVEIGAASALAACRGMRCRVFELRSLVVSGAGAGLSAVFNAPLSGMVFALEEMHHKFSAAVLLPALTAAVSAAVVVRAVFGPGTIFLFPEVPASSLLHLPHVVLLAVVSGVAAVPFNYALLHTDRFYGLPLFRNAASRIAFALAAAALLGIVLPEVLGGGDALVNHILAEGPLFAPLALLLLAKCLFTFISFGSGTPGGFFFPSLVIGALVGACAGSLLIGAGLLGPEYLVSIMILTMAAFFSATVRAPVTAAILLLEMTGNFQLLLPLAAASGIAYMTSGLLGGRPIYDELLKKQLAAKK